MKRILIDTNIYAEFKRKNPSVIEVLRQVDFIGVNVVVLAELLSGFFGGAKEEQNRQELNQFLDSSRVHVIPIDEETAEFYARIHRDLKRKGKMIPVNDIWVAASAMKNGLALFTHDEHFESVEGIMLLKNGGGL